MSPYLLYLSPSPTCPVTATTNFCLDHCFLFQLYSCSILSWNLTVLHFTQHPLKLFHFKLFLFPPPSLHPIFESFFLPDFSLLHIQRELKILPILLFLSISPLFHFSYFLIICFSFIFHMCLCLFMYQEFIASKVLL